MSAPGYDLDVLAFGPHPDDVELFCGGTLIRLGDLGHRTAVVDLTRGERGTHGSPEERARETAAANAILGLSFRENLGLPDTGIDPASPAQLAAAVEVLRRRRPEIVLLPWIEDRHPDHAAAAALLGKAVFYAGVPKLPTTPPAPRFVPRQVLYYPLRHRMTPSFVLDTSAAAERKAQAIACYQSQRALVPDAIEARDRYYGSMIGARHGEALRAPNVLGLVDPVRHFRENAFPGAYAFEPLR